MPPSPPARANDRRPSGVSPATIPRHRRRVLAVMGIALAAGVGLFALWWVGTADRREIQALPDEQRLPLYRRTFDNLRTVCDPAATRALMDFCQREADLALQFRECDTDPRCREMARRHLAQPHR